MSKQLGFTAIELLITVTVMAVILSFAIPQFRESKKRANETAAIASLRAVSSANSLYRQRNGRYGTLDELRATALIDETFAASRNGYDFVDETAPDAVFWAASAAPTDNGTTGDRFFYIDETGVIRTNDGSPADTSSNPIDL